VTVNRYHVTVFSPTVFSPGRDQKTLDEAVAELGPNARGYRADVTVAEDRKRLFADHIFL
jgi:hypothetical protein